MPLPNPVRFLGAVLAIATTATALVWGTKRHRGIRQGRNLHETEEAAVSHEIQELQGEEEVYALIGGNEDEVHSENALSDCSSHIPPAFQLSMMTEEEIYVLLKKHNLLSTGTKKEMVERLLTKSIEVKEGTNTSSMSASPSEFAHSNSTLCSDTTCNLVNEVLAVATVALLCEKERSKDLGTEDSSPILEDTRFNDQQVDVHRNGYTEERADSNIQSITATEDNRTSSIPLAHELSAMNVTDLQALLKDNGLSVTGSRKELLKRLLQKSVANARFEMFKQTIPETPQKLCTNTDQLSDIAIGSLSPAQCGTQPSYQDCSEQEGKITCAVMETGGPSSIHLENATIQDDFDTNLIRITSAVKDDGLGRYDPLLCALRKRAGSYTLDEQPLFATKKAFMEMVEKMPPAEVSDGLKELYHQLQHEAVQKNQVEVEQLQQNIVEAAAKPQQSTSPSVHSELHSKVDKKGNYGSVIGDDEVNADYSAPNIKRNGRVPITLSPKSKGSCSNSVGPSDQIQLHHLQLQDVSHHPTPQLCGPSTHQGRMGPYTQRGHPDIGSPQAGHPLPRGSHLYQPQQGLRPQGGLRDTSHQRSPQTPYSTAHNFRSPRDGPHSGRQGTYRGSTESNASRDSNQSLNRFNPGRGRWSSHRQVPPPSYWNNESSPSQLPSLPSPPSHIPGAPPPLPLDSQNASAIAHTPHSFGEPPQGSSAGREDSGASRGGILRPINPPTHASRIEDRAHAQRRSNVRREGLRPHHQGGLRDNSSPRDPHAPHSSNLRQGGLRTHHRGGLRDSSPPREPHAPHSSNFHQGGLRPHHRGGLRDISPPREPHAPHSSNVRREGLRPYHRGGLRDNSPPREPHAQHRTDVRREGPRPHQHGGLRDNSPPREPHASHSSNFRRGGLRPNHHGGLRDTGPTREPRALHPQSVAQHSLRRGPRSHHRSGRGNNHL